MASSGSWASVRLCELRRTAQVPFGVRLPSLPSRPSPKPRQCLVCLLSHPYSGLFTAHFPKTPSVTGFQHLIHEQARRPHTPHSIMKPRDYCCCAIPIVNAGIYATLLEQFTLGIVAGTLSVATPSSEYYPSHRLAARLTPLRSCGSRDILSRQMGVCDNLLRGGCRPTPWLHWRLPGQSHAASGNPS